MMNFGHDFQVKLALILLTDKDFSLSMYDLIKPEYFTHEGLQWLITAYKKYFSEYKKLPTNEVLFTELNKIDDETLTHAVKSIFIDISNIDSLDDAEYIKDTAREFCRTQSVRQALLKSVEFLEAGRLDDIFTVVSDALIKGQKPANSIDYLADIHFRQNLADELDHIPTGIPVLDKMMNGGLPRKMLGMIVGPSGTGKTWVLSKLSAEAVAKGYNVLYVTFELLEKLIARRHDIIYTNYTENELVANYPSAIEKIKEKVKGNLHISWFPPRVCSVIALKSLIERRIMEGVRPDIIVIDYMDLMKLSNPQGMARYDQLLQRTTEDLRSLAGEYNVAIWTATQTNRTGYDEKNKIVDASMFADAISKLFALDFCLSVYRNREHVLNNSATFYVIKNRMGIDKVPLDAVMDTSRGVLDIFDENDPRYSIDRPNKQEKNGKPVGTSLTVDDLMRIYDNIIKT